MIIVSQDKETIVNFNNITEITQKDGKIGITNDVSNNNFQLIAEYETEERAKEVLQEIANTYTKIGIIFDTFNGGKQQQLPIYEIPEN